MKMKEAVNETTMTAASNVTTTLVSEEDRRQYLQQLQDETTITMIPAIIFLTIVAVTGLVGNSTVLFVYSRKFQKNPTRILIMTIAVLDLVANILAIPGDMYDMFHIWDFDDASLCRGRMFVSAFSTLSAAFALVAVAVIRYRNVCKPHDWQVTITQAKVISVVVASLGVLCSIPYAITHGRQTKNTTRSDIFGYECTEDDSYKDTIWPMVINGFFLVLFISCCVPLIVLYVRIGVTAWESSRLHRSFKSDSEPGVQPKASGLKLPRAAKTRKLSVQALLHRPSVDSNIDVNVFDILTKQREKRSRLDTCLERITSRISKDGAKGDKTFGKEAVVHLEHVTDFKITEERIATIENNVNEIPENNDYTSFDVRHTENTPELSVSPPFIFVIDGCREVDKVFEEQNDIINKRTAETELPFVSTDIQRSSDNDLERDKLTYLDNKALIAPPRTKKRRSWRDVAGCPRLEFRQSAPEFYSKWCKFDDVGYPSQGLRVLSLRIPPEAGIDNSGAIGETDVDEAIPSTSSEFSEVSSDMPQESTSTTEAECSRSTSEEKTISSLENSGFENNEFINTGNITNKGSENNGALDTAEQSMKSTENIHINRNNTGLKQILNRIKSVGTNKKVRGERKGRKLSYLGRTTAILILISAVYALGFLPYLILNFFAFMAPEKYNNLNRTELSFYNLFVRLYFINSAANPIIYSLCGGKFRRECFSLLRCNSR